MNDCINWFNFLFPFYSRWSVQIKSFNQSLIYKNEMKMKRIIDKVEHHLVKWHKISLKCIIFRRSEHFTKWIRSFLFWNKILIKMKLIISNFVFYHQFMRAVAIFWNFFLLSFFASVWIEYDCNNELKIN